MDLFVKQLIACSHLWIYKWNQNSFWRMHNKQGSSATTIKGSGSPSSIRQRWVNWTSTRRSAAIIIVISSLFDSGCEFYLEMNRNPWTLSISRAWNVSCPAGPHFWRSGDTIDVAATFFWRSRDTLHRPGEELLEVAYHKLLGPKSLTLIKYATGRFRSPF